MSDMRADFEDAIAAVGEEEQPEDIDHGTVAEEPSEPEQEQAAEETTTETPEPSGAEGEEPPAAQADNSGSQSASENGKAPAGWTPAERELWGKLPPAVQARVNKREGEINRALNDGAENRKLGQQYKELSNKYQATFAAEGYADNHVEAIDGLVQVVTAMRFGTPEQKAQRIAGFIKNYGVDIGLLDNMLAGAAPSPEQQQNSQFEHLLDERLAPVNQLLSHITQAQQDRQQATTTQATDDVGTFSQQAEFIEDVRLDMADMMDLAAQRGQKMTLQEAYDKACAINPEISKVMNDRAEQQRILGNNQTVQEKINAASSIQGDQGGTGGGTQDLSLRQMIEAGFG